MKSKRKRTLNVFFAAFSGAFGFRKTSFGGGVGGWRGKWSITFLDNKPKFGLDCLIFGRMFYRDHIIQHTSCSLGSVLGNSALGTVFLDTVNPNPNIPLGEYQEQIITRKALPMLQHWFKLGLLHLKGSCANKGYTTLYSNRRKVDNFKQAESQHIGSDKPVRETCWNNINKNHTNSFDVNITEDITLKINWS